MKHTRDLVEQAACRLLDPVAVLSAAGARNGSLGSGLSGTALALARMSALDPVFATAAAQHWTAAAIDTRHQAASGIYAGPGGVATSLIVGTPYLPDPKAHHDAAARGARWLSTLAVNVAERHQANRDTTTPWAVYDAINGLAGLGRVLLSAAANGHTAAEPGLVTALQTLTTMINTPQGNRPGWWLPPEHHPTGATSPPSGAANTGMAHGIAGPLAFLSSAHTTGWQTPGQTEAIRTAAAWLLHWRNPNIWRWHPWITGDELDRQTLDTTAGGRHDAWCHGTPGIGRALTLAGQALLDPALADAGTTAVDSLATRNSDAWDTDGPALCHGHAGVLQSATATASTVAGDAAEAIANAADPALPYVFSDRPGFLTGAAGVVLALADYAQVPAHREDSNRWDAILLLS